MKSKSRKSDAFSILEMLVATVVLTVIVGLLLSIMGQASGLWKTSSSRGASLQSARASFENLTRLLSQATLNPYLDYDDSNNPKRYIRQSELHFIVDQAQEILGTGDYYGQAIFFQSPAQYNPGAPNTEGLTGLLNACGFFVEFSSDKERGWLPNQLGIPGTSRFRLMQWVQPSDRLSLYKNENVDAFSWISTHPKTEAVPVADNVIGLFLWPMEAGGQPVTQGLDSYRYDSKEGADSNPQSRNANLLPPMIRVAMVTIDEASVSQLGRNLKTSIESCLNGLFQGSPSESFERDLQSLESALAARKIGFRVFSTTISLNEATWASRL